MENTKQIFNKIDTVTKRIKYSYIVFLLIILSSCDPCVDNRLCADVFSFKLIDKISKQDLVLGPGRVYSTDSVYLTTKLPGYSGSMSSYDSVNKRFQSRLSYPSDTFFLRVSFADTDTILVNYEYLKSKCCEYSLSGYGQIKNMQYNGTMAAKVGENYIFEK